MIFNRAGERYTDEMIEKDDNLNKVWVEGLITNNPSVLGSCSSFQAYVFDTGKYKDFLDAHMNDGSSAVPSGGEGRSAAYDLDEVISATNSATGLKLEMYFVTEGYFKPMKDCKD